MAQNADLEENAILAVPGKVNNADFGLLLKILDEKPQQQWSKEERQLVEQVLGQVSLALENAQLSEQNIQLLKALEHDRQCFSETYQRLQKQVQEERDQLLIDNETYYQCSIQIAAAQNVANVLAALCDRTFLGEAENTAAIHIFDRPWTAGQTPEWIFVIDQYSSITHEDNLSSYRLASFPSASQYLHADTPTIISSVGSDPRLDQGMRRFLIAHYKARSALFVPLVAAAKWIGYILGGFQQSVEISENRVRQLVILAAHAASAIQNIRSQWVEEAEKADQLKCQFMEIINDELSTQLKSIIGFSRLVMNGIDGPITPRQKEDLTAIYNLGQHLLNVTNDLLDLSKIRADNLKLSLDERVNLIDLIKSVISASTKFTTNKPVELHADLPVNLPLISADSTRIRQVLIHLLSNVAKLSGDGTIFIEASVQAGPTGQAEILIQVSDTSTGTVSEEQEEIFQAFSQKQTSPNIHNFGSSLGLFICRHLIELHGGRTGYDCEPGQGIKFYFTLPIYPLER